MARREPLVAPPSVTGSERFVKPTAMRHAGAVAWREEGGQSNNFRRQMVMHAPTAAALPLVHAVLESVVTRLVVDLSGPAATTSSVPQWMFYNMRGVLSGHSDTHFRYVCVTVCFVLPWVCAVLGVM